MSFSDKLKDLMNQNKMKAVDLAKATGLSEAIISDYLKGKKEPRGRQSIAIAKVLNVSLDVLWETNFISEIQKERNTTLTNEEQLLISNFRILNEEGQKKVTNYTLDLIDTKKYENEMQKDNHERKYQYKLTSATRGQGLIEQVVETHLSPEELEKISKESAAKKDRNIF